VKNQMNNEDSEPTIEDILKTMGVRRDKAGKKIAYQHWKDFITMVKEHSGEDWKHVRLLMRSVVNVDFRYIDDYSDTCAEYGFVEIKNDKIYFIPRPKDVKISKTQKGKPFPPYGPPPEHEDETEVNDIE